MTTGPASSEWRRLYWALAAIILVVAVPETAAFVRGLRQEPPPQPMRFSHIAHEKDAECTACHLYADTLATAGTPTLSDCLDCHEGIQSKRPDDKREEARLETYAKQKREIPWIPLPRLTSDVYFSHRQHVALSKIKCDVCHGGIAKTGALPSERAVDFTMGWCMKCHERREASLDCLDCHR